MISCDCAAVRGGLVVFMGAPENRSTGDCCFLVNYFAPAPHRQCRVNTPACTAERIIAVNLVKNPIHLGQYRRWLICAARRSCATCLDGIRIPGGTDISARPSSK